MIVNYILYKWHLFSTVFFHFFSFGMGPRPNQPTSTSSRLDQLHARVERFFFSPTSKNCGGFWGSEFWGLKLSTLKKGEYIRRDKIGRIFMAKGYTPLIVLCLYNLNWKNPEFFFLRCDYVRFPMWRASNNPGVRIWLQTKRAEILPSTGWPPLCHMPGFSLWDGCRRDFGIHLCKEDHPS